METVEAGAACDRAPVTGMSNGRETATSRAARIWATVRSGAATYRGSDARRQTDFWHDEAEEKAYIAGFCAGQAEAARANAKAWEQGYAEAVARIGKRARDAAEKATRQT